MKIKGFIPYIFGIFCTAIYLSLVFNNNVWLDEAFSASIIRCGFKEMISRTLADTLPPFYNISAWLFTRIFGFSTITLKVFSVVPMVLLMLAAAFYIPKTESCTTSCLYMAMITVMPHFLEHGVEIRMYSWAVLFSSLTAIFACCMVNGLRHAEIGLIICTVLGAYTHQYALIAESFIWLMLLVLSLRNGSFIKWLKYAVISILLYIPCAVMTFFQMKRATSYFTASPADVKSLMASVRYPFVTNFTILSAILMVFVILLFIFSCSVKMYISAYYMLIYVLTIFLSFGIMLITESSFFTSRYLMPSFGILWLGAAMALGRLLSENKHVYFVSIPIMLTVFSADYIQQFRSEYVDMSRFESFIASTGPEDAFVIYEDYPEVEICLQYYAPWLRSYDINGLSAVKGKKYAFFNGDVHVDDIEKIKKENYELRYIENLMFDRYTFRAYELIGRDSY